MTPDELKLSSELFAQLKHAITAIRDIQIVASLEPTPLSNEDPLNMLHSLKAQQAHYEKAALAYQAAVQLVDRQLALWRRYYPEA